MNNYFIKKLTDIVEANLENEKFGVEDLVREMGISHISLHRKLKTSSNQTISQFIREIRLKKAKELLLKEDLTVSEIAYQVGFGSPTYFNKCFHEYFGYPPGESKSHDLIIESIEKPENAVLKKTRRTPILIGLIISLIIIIPLTILVIQGGSFSKSANAKEKSIAILPFKYLSDEPEKQYLADGMMDAILLHLSGIKDLHIISRTSVEQYRKTDKTVSAIGKKLGVSYLLEGSFLKDGDKARLIVKLIQTNNEKQVWSNEYDREWKDIFFVQSEVAETIASELQAIITPEEQQLIRKLPTVNLTAYDFYQRGRNEFLKYETDNGNKAALEKAMNLYHKALSYDSTFAQAYIGLARIYGIKQYWDTYFAQNFMDSVLILVDIALTYDDQLAEAYSLRGDCYREIGNTEQAVREYDKAIRFNPNDWMAYLGKGRLAHNDDLVNAIDNLQKAASLNHGPELPFLLRFISSAYDLAGFIEKSNYYSQEALKLDDDSLQYYRTLAGNERDQENYINAIEYLKKGYAIDSTNVDILNNLGFNYMSLGQFKESLKYYKKWVERLKVIGNLTPNNRHRLNNMHRIGYVYWKNGYKKEADFYFDKQVEYCNNLVKSGRPYAQLYYTYYDLAGVYAFRGEKEKAYENLRSFNQRQRMPLWMAILIKNDPLFDNMRNEPEFQQIVWDVNAKYQAEHNRVGKWLEEQKML
jgi:TolB-like protein/AraC-like DNA-binding protein/Flp pilus assembly protein TadD